MILRGIRERLMAVPWVYNRVRPLLIGSDYYATLARFCRAGQSDRVFDLGCGTGQLLRYLRCARYLGVDADPSALQHARRFADEHISFIEGEGWGNAYRELDPTVVLMLGVIHHLPDEEFGTIIARMRKVGQTRPRIVTFDTSFFPGHLLNNFLSYLDRGRYVRRPGEYEALFAANGLCVTDKELVYTRQDWLGRIGYVGYHLELQE